MAAPTSPTIEELAGRGESEQLAEIVNQARRNVTAAGGTADTAPSIDQLKGMDASQIYPHIIRANRQLEDLL